MPGQDHMSTPLLWHCPPEVAQRFVASLEQAEMGRISVEEAVDQVRSLPQFPIEWTPGRPIRMVITHPIERPMVQVPR